jgi:hypothetical protein
MDGQGRKGGGRSRPTDGAVPGIKLLRVTVKERGPQVVGQRAEVLKARSCTESVSGGRSTGH